VLGQSSQHSATEVRGWMEVEFEQAQRERTPAALMRVRVEGFDRLAPRRERRRVVLSSVLEGVRASPRGGDILACRDGDDLIVLLPGTSPEAAELIARQSIERARKLALPDAAAPQRASLCIGLAYVQNDLDLYFDTLLQVAEEGLAVASNSGGERFIHTQLYGLFQRQVERVRGPRAPRSAAPPKPLGVPTKAAALPSPPVATAALAPAAIPAPNVIPTPAAISAPVVTSAPTVIPEPTVIGENPGLGGKEVALNGVPSVESIVADPLFEARIKDAFAAQAPGPKSSVDLERRVLELSRAWAQDALAVMMKRAEDRHTSEIDLYERRIQKLAQALSETEEELRRIANLKAVEPGVASAYRSVQGLDQAENQYAAKLSLLSKILQANLELRAKLGGPAPAT
jgi:GGDEF domain-containing protein